MQELVWLADSSLELHKSNLAYSVCPSLFVCTSVFLILQIALVTIALHSVFSVFLSVYLTVLFNIFFLSLYLILVSVCLFHLFLSDVALLTWVKVFPRPGVEKQKKKQQKTRTISRICL